MDEEDDLELPEGARFAGRSERGRHLWKASESKADEKSASFVLATGKEVRHNPMWQDGGDVIRIREFKLAEFRENPVVLMEHDYRHVIGRGSAKIEAVSENEHRLVGDVVWDIGDHNPLAVLAAAQHANGSRSAVSIGFMPGKGSTPRTKLPVDDAFHMDPEKFSSWRAGMLYRNCVLYEFSSVAVPKDPGALQLRQWALEAETEDQRVARIVEEILTRRGADIVLSAFRASPELRTAITAATLAELPATPSDTPNPKVQSAPEDADGDWWSNWQ